MGSSPGEPKAKVGANARGTVWTIVTSAAGPGSTAAIPMHMAAQQFLPSALSGEPVSCSPGQCAEGTAWLCSTSAVREDGVSMAFAVTGANRTATASSAWRSLPRLFDWRIRFMGAE